MEKTRLVIFDETTLEDFHDLILPNVLQELYALDDFDDYGIIALGAARGESFVGALIARILTETDLQILSLYVDPDHRRTGVATALLDGITERGFELFDTAEQLEVPVGICLDYVMEDAAFGEFSAFLDHAGFRFREEWPCLYAFPADAEALLTGGSAHELPSEVYDDIVALLEDVSLDSAPECCVYGGEDDVRCIVLAVDGGEDTYDVYSSTESGCTDAEFEAALKLLLQKLGPAATVYADGRRNLCPGVLEKAAAAGQRLRRCYAQRRLIIEKEVAE